MSMVTLNPGALKIIASMRVKADKSISDTWTVKRSLKERYLTFPWRPWATTRSYYCPRAFILPDGTIVVSHKTKALLAKIS